MMIEFACCIFLCEMECREFFSIAAVIAELQLSSLIGKSCPRFLDLTKNEGLLGLFYLIKTHLTRPRGYKSCFLA